MALAFVCWCWWSVVAAAAMAAVWRSAEWLWLRPRRLERALLAQGLRGSPYRLPYGDIKDMKNLVSEARKKPMPLSHRIVPRVVPQLQRALDLYGGNRKMPFIWFGPYPRVMIMDPEIIKDILSHKSDQLEKPKSNPYGRLLVSGVAAYVGKKWAKHRRIINPAFHVEKLKGMMPAFSACCEELINKWEVLASKGSYELNIWPEFQSFTGDVISRTAFGSSYKEGQRIFELQMEQGVLHMQAAQTLYVPGLRFLPTQKNRRRNEVHKEVVLLLKRLIEQRESAIRSREASTNDLLGLLLEFNPTHSNGCGNHSKEIGLTTEDVIEECKLFYFAGQETTAVLLTWTMIVLSMHPDWQHRAREEVLHVFGQSKPDFESLSRLKIMNMILHEVLRLYPPGPFLIRQIYKEMRLGEFNFPAGIQLLLPVILIHHSTEFWGEDAEEFYPERFAEGVSKVTKNQLVFFPFSWGPRICPGQSFALTEAKMCLAEILRRFSFELSPSYAHAPCQVFTLRPQHGAQVILHRL
ncbi:Secologanin synthase [Apostasia shenzhenica]|uniref:Secologanin synthase n=1 Tax=Apostasia shenzhenica TaxID=1088818 RepID=A0A2I0AZU7_9ASPA|nr:Secologanin synthase [Apostasia shenzhenica]